MLHKTRCRACVAAAPPAEAKRAKAKLIQHGAIVALLGQSHWLGSVPPALAVSTELGFVLGFMTTRQRHRLKLEVLPQPDSVTCGPTCLHAVYRYFGDSISLEEVIDQVTVLPAGGTLAVLLGCHALRRGYSAEIYTYNLQVFDPTWFRGRADLVALLEAQRRVKSDPKLQLATNAYLDFLRLGGRIKYEPLSAGLLRRFLNREIPILTGLSATYLYDCAREYRDEYDNVRGEPMGHFVVLSGYDREKREVRVSDPLHDNPRYKKRYYSVSTERLLASILLGIVTYDANLLIVGPSGASAKEGA